MTANEAERAEQQAQRALLEFLHGATEADLDRLIRAVQEKYPEVTAATVRAAILSLVNRGAAEVTARGQIRELAPA